MIILGIILIILGMIILINLPNINSVVIILIGEFAMIIGISLIIRFHYDIPKAIDVYRGNTTLEITYKDSIPVDTVIIFKNK